MQQALPRRAARRTGCGAPATRLLPPRAAGAAPEGALRGAAAGGAEARGGLEGAPPGPRGARPAPASPGPRPGTGTAACTGSRLPLSFLAAPQLSGPAGLEESRETHQVHGPGETAGPFGKDLGEAHPAVGSPDVSQPTR